MSIAYIGGDKALVLCQHGSPSTPRACSSRRRWGSPLSLDRSVYPRVLFVVGLHVHEWGMLRSPSWHEMSAATGRRSAAFQPVLTCYLLLDLARSGIATHPCAPPRCRGQPRTPARLQSPSPSTL